MEIENDPTLTVIERREGEGCLLEAVGEIDLATKRLLLEPLMKAAQDPATWPVTADLSRVLFTDSSGLTALLAANKALAARSRRLRVVLSPGSQPDRALRLSRLIDVMDVADLPSRPSTDEAQ